MTDEEKEKLNKAHRFFSADCFNQIWTILEKTDKDEKDLETMIHLAHTSFWHWINNPNVQPVNIATGYWMLSRVYVTALDSVYSLYFAEKCLLVNQQNHLDEFSLGYAYEALARASQIAGNSEQACLYLEKGIELAEKVQDEESKGFLVADLKGIQKD